MQVSITCRAKHCGYRQWNLCRHRKVICMHREREGWSSAVLKSIIPREVGLCSTALTVSNRCQKLPSITIVLSSIKRKQWPGLKRQANRVSPQASASAISTESFKPSALSIPVSSEHDDLFKLPSLEDNESVHYDPLERTKMEEERQNTVSV